DVEVDVDVDVDVEPAEPAPIPPPPPRPIPRAPTLAGIAMAPPPIPGARPVAVVPPRPPTVRIPALGARPSVPRLTPPAMPTVTMPAIAPAMAIPPPAIAVPPREADEPAPARPRAVTGAPPIPGSSIAENDLEIPSPDMSLAHEGMEVSTGIANIVVDQPLEAHLDSPTVIDRALSELGDAGSEQRATAMANELAATTDAAAAAFLAYELGEHCERRLADEASAVKAYGRALTLDPSLRPNLWAIRRVFYRRALWPNLVKLISAEVEYARDDLERADLLLEKARIAGHHMADLAEARAALDEAVRISPAHQGALLELERIVAKAGDVPALLDVWELLAEAVEQPARKASYWLEVGRAAASTAGGKDYPRAQEAFERASGLITYGPAAERLARERLRIADQHGATEDINAAIEKLVTLLLAAFGPAGPGEATQSPSEVSTGRATQIRREVVALRRRQAQFARAEAPGLAWDMLQLALALAPGEPLLLADLTELAEELGRYEDLAELVQSWQAVEADPGRAMALSIRRADALLRGGQRDQARALLASLEASAAGFIVLTSAAERDALGRSSAPDLAKTYVAAGQAALLGSWLGPGQAPVPDPGAAAALFVQAAQLLAYEVGGQEAIDEARSALGKALEAVPGYPPALEALTELDDATGRVAEALARLTAAAQQTHGDDRRAIYERAIRLARSHSDLEATLELERALAELAPSDLALRWRLESTLAQLGRDDERAQILTGLGAEETDPTRRGTALVAAARLRERAGSVEVATDLYRQVLVLWPDDTFARESLIDLLRAQERWTELVTERRAEARGLPDGAAARRALREAAWILEVRLGDHASAAQIYNEWLVRVPDDRTALEGVARCRAAFGDRLGEVVARRAIAELDASSETQWLLGSALERAGQFDDAVEVFRALSMRDEASVAATSAALALADLAAGRADTVMRVEATATLAGRTTEPRLGAALAEDSGWMYALVLEDFERAQQSFGAAITLEPRRGGALLGAALVAARRGDLEELSAAYDGLAASVQMPDAAAALHLRAAATAAANGDLELANQRVAAARLAAPDDTSALLVLAETTATPQVDRDASESADGEGAAAAIERLLDRAEVLEMRAALADDPTARASWELDRAEALELAGRLREAGIVVAAVLKTQSGDVRALEALRRMAKRAGDDQTWAQASYQLARVLGDPAGKLALLRDAASVFDQSSAPNATELALAIYKRILVVDPGAVEHDRLLDLLREKADVLGLTTALTERLTWLEAEQQDATRDHEMVPLLLERATVVHGMGDSGAAMADLDALLDRAASHVEALRFRADLAFNAGEVELAVSLWRRCIAAETRPRRRAEIELQLSQVLAENVNDLAGAIENLERVVEANPDDLLLRERLLGLCLRVNDWDRATRELRALARLRPTPQDQARDELRLALMLRDRLNDRQAATLALERASSLDPLNLDIVRELSELVEPTARAQLLSGTVAAFRASIMQNAKSAVLYERLAQVTGWQGDTDARWLALVGLESLGTPSADQRQVLEQGRHRIGVPTQHVFDDHALRAIRGPSGGPLAELWRAIAPAVQVATGVDAGKLGFSRGDRVALKKLGDKYEPLATALACFRIEEIEIYISAARGGVARALAAETPILCLGADVAAAKMPHQRWLLGRTVATLAEGFATLPDLREPELGWTIVAALRAAEVAVPAGIAEEVTGEDASIADRTKLLKKELNRKARTTIAQLVQQQASSVVDIAGFRRNALAVGHRAGLAWAGDLAVALAQLDVGKGGKSITDSPVALELTGWSVSEEHTRLREALGIALQAGPKGVR
ncbi:MAG: Tetratricopeptide 2 repeat protein, partial [Deltaproteobacteria bacterium]|nr:Tetratricopeptide 2 repeat protein [Deltaproteobacteria bacterium]